MAEAVDLAKLHGAGPVNAALERCAAYGRFADGDLASILPHQQTATVIALPTRVGRTCPLARFGYDHGTGKHLSNAAAPSTSSAPATR